MCTNPTIDDVGRGHLVRHVGFQPLHRFSAGLHARRRYLRIGAGAALALTCRATQPFRRVPGSGFVLFSIRFCPERIAAATSGPLIEMARMPRWCSLCFLAFVEVLVRGINFFFVTLIRPVGFTAFSIRGGGIKGTRFSGAIWHLLEQA
mmetsp:Transcript_60689/g.141411  ORF Transcript_60689/g.141411 Transcript_60689/m.141411 type:complete len:149 (+) Transcript_60689:453-899(+)